jgi:CRISPR-associated protein (TIGR02584 family)
VVFVLSTTRAGKKRAKLGLITERNLSNLLNEYDIPAITFSEQHIHCIEKDGDEIMDALSKCDHE